MIHINTISIMGNIEDRLVWYSFEKTVELQEDKVNNSILKNMMIY